MNIQHEIHPNGIPVIQISGRLAGQETRKIREKLQPIINTSSALVFDCSKLEYIDSSGLGVLLKELKLAISRNGDLRLAGLLVKVQMMLEITRADKIFKIYPTVDEAVASFNSNTLQSEGM